MLKIHLFKTMRVVPEDAPSFSLGSPTARSLLAYLVLHRSTPLDRRHLAFLLWPHASEAVARRNLRQYLHRLHLALVPIEQRSLLVVTEHTVQIAPDADLWVDVEEFRKHANDTGDALAASIELYEGDLLEEVYDDWTIPEREQLRCLYLAALERLAQHYRVTGRLSEAIVMAQRLLAADPIQERSHALLMALYYAQGDRARALQQFKTCVRVLQDELGVAPLPETHTLYETMLDGTYQGGVAGPTDLAALALPSAKLAPSGSALRPAPLAIHQSAQSPPSPFVGRRAELSQIGAWLAALRSAQGRIVLVRGEPGVGKTRLVHEALQAAHVAGSPLTVFAGRGREFETMRPYHPLAEALRNGAGCLARPRGPDAAWMSVIARFVPELAPRFGLSSRTATESLQDRYQLVEALGSMFLEQAARGATVLFLDDAQWVDQPTWEFLGYLARRCETTALLVICAAQTEALLPEATRLIQTLVRQQMLSTLDMGRLSPGETADLVAQLGLAADAVLIRRLYEETAGNPFFLTETVRALHESGGNWSIPTDAAGERPAFAVPLSVRAVIEARLDRLPDLSRQWLAVAAAMGHTFRLDVLAQIADDMPECVLITALEEWLARRLVREAGQVSLGSAVVDGSNLLVAQPDPAYQFEHDLIRHVAYEQMSPVRRRWAHRRFAEVAERDPARTDCDPAEIAYHFLQSDSPARALAHLIAAGEQALAVRSYRQARQFGQQAVGLLKDWPASAGQREGRVDLNLQLALAYSFTDEVDRALAILQETEGLAAALDDKARLGSTHRHIAQVLWHQGRPGPAGEYARRAQRLAEELGDDRLLAASLRMIGRVSIATSAFDDAISVLRQCLALPAVQLDRPGLAVIHGYRGVAWARLGAWSEALASADFGVKCAQETLSPSTMAVADMNLALIKAEKRSWHDCLAIAQRGLPLCEGAGFSPHGFMLQVLAGRALCEHGAVAEGRARIRQALEEATENNYRLFLHLAHLALAETGLAREMDRSLGVEVGHAIESALNGAAAAGDRWARAVALRLRAELQEREPAPDWARAEADLAESCDLLWHIRGRAELARTYLSLRRLCERTGQMPRAVDCHLRALSIFQELGMTEELRAAQGFPPSLSDTHPPAHAGMSPKRPQSH